MKLHKFLFVLPGFLFSALVFADMKVTVHAVSSEGVHDAIGEVYITESDYGLVFQPSLEGLSPGLHGFHIHENPSCEPMERDGKMIAALSAGSHYDPAGTGRHGPPWGDGHLGVLPSIYATPEGTATHPVLAPRVKLSDLEGRALMIHDKGDNYSDDPLPLGGGAARVACGVF